jgi:endo-1,4-beta-D-glucanase Y
MNKPLKTAKRRRYNPALIIMPILVLSILIGSAIAQPSVRRRLVTNDLIYSKSAALSETWHKFTISNIDLGSGRSLTDHTSNITSAQSQSLTLLRSVWIDDKATFDAGWHWTKVYGLNDSELQSRSYGPRPDNTYGVIDNTADSTADTNTALALLMAYSRWGDEKDLNDAETLINAIYTHEITSINGSPSMLASNYEAKSGTTLQLAPSAFNVAAFREFAKVDPSHDWTSVIESSYQLLNSIVDHANGNIPDTAQIDTRNGMITVNGTSFGLVGSQAIFNLGLDSEWYKDGRDLTLLAKLKSLSLSFKKTGSVTTSTGQETKALNGMVLAYFDATKSSINSGFYQDKILINYNQDKQEWRNKLNFNDDTWVWLAIGLHENALRHLTEK